MRYTLILPIVLIFSLWACQSDKKDTATNQATSKTTTNKYTLTPFSASPSFPDARIDGMTYKDGRFEFAISGNYDLGAQTTDAKTKMCANSDKGQHIHLIVGTAPYAAKYVPEFDYEIANGNHKVLAFLSRSYHESIKSPGASMALNVTVNNGNITNSTSITEPSLFYSRPKGTYVGKENTDKVMLDFFLVNANLTQGYSVKANINGENHDITKWQPYYIEGLPMGENSITLTLYKDGKVVQSDINPVTRKFTLKADPAG